MMDAILAMLSPPKGNGVNSLHWFLVPVVLALGAVGRRVAGGVLNQWAGLAGGNDARVMGDTPARLIYAAAIALAGVLGGLSWLLIVPLIAAVWAGSTTGNFNSIGMGRGGNTFAHDWWGMSAHGAITGAMVWFVVAPWPWWGSSPHWYLAGLGFLSAPIWYALAWALCGRWGQLRFPTGVQTGSDMAEALWGAATALAVFSAFF